MDSIDISKQHTVYPATIDQVGLDQVELPLKVRWADSTQNVLASFQTSVSLNDPQLRGIHMSRIYLKLYEFSQSQTLTPHHLQKLLEEMIQAQNGISSQGRIYVSWKGGFKQTALSSSYTGWRVYPCFYEYTFSEEKQDFIMGAKLLYSSTCPCSASLSRDLIKEQFEKDKPQSKEEMIQWLDQESSIAGTPHAQRSEAFFKLKTTVEKLPYWIQQVEKKLATPVQSAVKREDEKHFAHLNAKNLMYSEDAIRRIKHYFDSQNEIKDYFIQVRHFESLHPFDTIAQLSKNGDWTQSK